MNLWEAHHELYGRVAGLDRGPRGKSPSIVQDQRSNKYYAYCSISTGVTMRSFRAKEPIVERVSNVCLPPGKWLRRKFSGRRLRRWRGRSPAYFCFTSFLFRLHVSRTVVRDTVSLVIKPEQKFPKKFSNTFSLYPVLVTHIGTRRNWKATRVSYIICIALMDSTTPFGQQRRVKGIK